MKLRQNYEAQRVRFFKLEDEQLKNSMGVHNHGELKGKMTNNSQQLLNQKSQLEKTKNLGIEACENLKGAGVELRK